MRKKGRGNRLSVWAAIAEHWSAILAVVTTIASFVSAVSWYRVDRDNRLLELKLHQAQAEKEALGASMLKPGFSVQYLVFGGAVYQAVKQGESNPGPLGVIRKTKEARAAYESLYEFPLVDTQLDAHMPPGSIYDFLAKYSAAPLGKHADEDELVALKYTVLVISCFGGSIARDVELVYEERTSAKDAFMFPGSGIRYSDNQIQTTSNAPRQDDDSLFQRTVKSLALGDIEPGHGRIVPIQIGLVPEGVTLEDGSSAYFEVLSSLHLKPTVIRFRTLTGDTIEQPIREQLAIPMPVSDFIDIRG